MTHVTNSNLDHANQLQRLGYRFVASRHYPVEWVTGMERMEMERQMATKSRIYDNPNHEHYGPVRRMWVLLAQLALLDQDSRFTVMHGLQTWDELLANTLSWPIWRNESEPMQLILMKFLKLEWNDKEMAAIIERLETIQSENKC